jgi:hypothetical protein
VPRDRRRRRCGSSRGNGLADTGKTCCSDCPVASAERRSTSHCRIVEGQWRPSIDRIRQGQRRSRYLEGRQARYHAASGLKQTLTLRLRVATSEKGVRLVVEQLHGVQRQPGAPDRKFLLETFRSVRRGFEAHLASNERDAAMNALLRSCGPLFFFLSLAKLAIRHDSRGEVVASGHPAHFTNRFPLFLGRRDQ